MLSSCHVLLPKQKTQLPLLLLSSYPLLQLYLISYIIPLPIPFPNDDSTILQVFQTFLLKNDPFNAIFIYHFNKNKFKNIPDALL